MLNTKGICYSDTVRIKEWYQCIQHGFILIVIGGIFIWYPTKQYFVMSEFLISRDYHLKVSSILWFNGENSYKGSICWEWVRERGWEGAAIVWRSIFVSSTVRISNIERLCAKVSWNSQSNSEDGYAGSIVWVSEGGSSYCMKINICHLLWQEPVAGDVMPRQEAL